MLLQCTAEADGVRGIVDDADRMVSLYEGMDDAHSSVQESCLRDCAVQQARATPHDLPTLHTATVARDLW